MDHYICSYLNIVVFSSHSLRHRTYALNIKLAADSFAMSKSVQKRITADHTILKAFQNTNALLEAIVLGPLTVKKKELEGPALTLSESLKLGERDISKELQALGTLEGM
jgi:hypothetical protein